MSECLITQILCKTCTERRKVENPFLRRTWMRTRGIDHLSLRLLLLLLLNHLLEIKGLSLRDKQGILEPPLKEGQQGILERMLKWQLPLQDNHLLFRPGGELLEPKQLE